MKKINFWAFVKAGFALSLGFAACSVLLKFGAFVSLVMWDYIVWMLDTGDWAL